MLELAADFSKTTKHARTLATEGATPKTTLTAKQRWVWTLSTVERILLAARRRLAKCVVYRQRAKRQGPKLTPDAETALPARKLTFHVVSARQSGLDKSLFVGLCSSTRRPCIRT